MRVFQFQLNYTGFNQTQWHEQMSLYLLQQQTQHHFLQKLLTQIEKIYVHEKVKTFLGVK